MELRSGRRTQRLPLAQEQVPFSGEGEQAKRTQTAAPVSAAAAAAAAAAATHHREGSPPSLLRPEHIAEEHAEAPLPQDPIQQSISNLPLATQKKLLRLLPPKYAAEIDTFIRTNIEQGQSATLDRISSFIYVLSNGLVSTDQARRYVRLRYPEYSVTRTMPVALARKNTMRTLFGARLGFYMMDLCYLRPTVAGHSHAQFACLVIYCCAGTQLMLLETVYGGKSARALQRALEACQERLITHYGRKEGLKRLYSDREGGMLSREMAHWLKEHKIEIVFMGELKAQKAYLSEAAIKRLRVELKRQQIVLGSKSSFNPYDELPRIEKGHNARHLVIGKAISPWSPSSITSDTYSDYIDYVYRLQPIAYFSLFSVGDGYIPYRFELDDVCFLKMGYSSSDRIKKRSIIQINTQQPYRIAARFTVVSAHWKLVAYYRILPAFDLLNTTWTPETLDEMLHARGLLVPEGALTAE